MKFQPDTLAGTNTISRFDGRQLWVGPVLQAGSVLVPWVGAVQPWPLAGPAELTAGQKLSVELRPVVPVVTAKPVPVPAAAIRQTLAWQERRLEFDATPLAEIVVEFNRHTRHELVIADERLRVVRFGGSFAVTDYETFVRMLEKDFGVVAERGEAKTLLRLRAP